MKRILVTATCLVLLLSFGLCLSAKAFGTDIIPFEEVLADYGIDESRVVGEFTLDESAEIPIYDFKYVFKISFFKNPIGYVRALFRAKKYIKHTKVPAVQMYVEDWEQYGQLFVIPFKSAWGVDRGLKTVTDYELDLSSYPLPAYRIYTNVVEPGPDGEPRNVVINKQAVEMKEKLLGLWNGSIPLTEVECIEHNGRVVEMSVKVTRRSRIENPDLRNPYCDYPSERLIGPPAMRSSKTYSGCCLPVDNYEALRHSNFRGIKA